MGETTKEKIKEVVETALVVIKKVASAVIRPFKGKQAFTEFALRVREAFSNFLRGSKKKKKEKKSWSEKVGVDPNKVATLKANALNMVMMSSFNLNIFRYAATQGATALKEPSQFDILRKDIWVWKQMHLHRAYNYL